MLQILNFHLKNVSLTNAINTDTEKRRKNESRFLRRDENSLAQPFVFPFVRRLEFSYLTSLCALHYRDPFLQESKHPLSAAHTTTHREGSRRDFGPDAPFIAENNNDTERKLFLRGNRFPRNTTNVSTKAKKNFFPHLLHRSIRVDD